MADGSAFPLHSMRRLWKITGRPRDGRDAAGDGAEHHGRSAARSLGRGVGAPRSMRLCSFPAFPTRRSIAGQGTLTMRKTGTVLRIRSFCKSAQTDARPVWTEKSIVRRLYSIAPVFVTILRAICGAIRVSIHFSTNCGVIWYFMAADTDCRALSNSLFSRCQLVQLLCTLRRF